MKKIIATALLLCLAVVLLTSCSLSGSAEQFSDGVVAATFNKETGTLTFSGDGAVDRVYKWVKLKEEDAVFVQNIVFEKGITSVGNCEFNSINSYPNLTKVTFKGDINAIGDCAFSDNPNLATVTFCGDCKSIGSLAFFECYALTDVNVPVDCKVDSLAFSDTPLEEAADTAKPSADSTENDYSTPEPPMLDPGK